MRARLPEPTRSPGRSSSSRFWRSSCTLSSCSSTGRSPTLGTPTLVSWLLPFDPFLYLSSILRNGGLTLAVSLPLLLVVLTLFGGRFFCGWVCPLGTLFDLDQRPGLWRKMQRGKLFTSRRRPSRR